MVNVNKVCVYIGKGGFKGLGVFSYYIKVVGFCKVVCLEVQNGDHFL